MSDVTHDLGAQEVSNWVRKSKAISLVVRLPGDASTRRYYRIHSKSGSGRGAGQSFIVMRMEPFEKEGEKLPFLVVQKHLAACSVDVPRVLDVDAANGFVLLEDWVT